MLLCVAMLFCSCGEEEELSWDMNSPWRHLSQRRSIAIRSHIFSCFTPEAEAEYKNSDSYNEALAETLLTRGEEKTELSCKLSSKKELDSDGKKDLEKSYKESYHKNVTIKKAVTMTAKLTETTDSGELSASREITVVKIENNWYIFGKVIEKFDLSQKG